MDESCKTCRHRLSLEKWDYSNGGCVHKKITDGFACMACAHEGAAIWMVGTDADTGFCECYEPKRKEAVRRG